MILNVDGVLDESLADHAVAHVVALEADLISPHLKVGQMPARGFVKANGAAPIRTDSTGAGCRGAPHALLSSRLT